MPWKFQDAVEVASETIYLNEWKCQTIEGTVEKAKKVDPPYSWHAWNDKESSDIFRNPETVKIVIYPDIWALNKQRQIVDVWYEHVYRLLPAKGVQI